MSLKDLYANLQHFLERKNYSSIVILSDANVFPSYGDSLVECLKKLNIKTLTCIVLDPGELSKNLEAAKTCWEEMHRAGVDRYGLLIGLGGGVVTDLAGFVASCYMRGLETLYIPTTLMGMVDAAFGGKTGINLAGGKNLVGTFHMPQAVLCSTDYLKTLPDREYKAGLAEIVKYGIIEGPDLFEKIEKNTIELLSKEPALLNEIIKTCQNTKLRIVQKDEKEKNLRATLNLGHTFAHALEAATNYSIYLHGEAVAIGLMCAFYTSYALGMIEENLVTRLNLLLTSLNLPTRLPDLPPLEEFIHLMKGDKKNFQGSLNLILVEGIGKVRQVLDVDPQFIREGFKRALLENSIPIS